MTKLTSYILIIAAIAIILQMEHNIHLLTSELKTANNKIQITENKVAELKKAIANIAKH